MVFEPDARSRERIQIRRIDVALSVAPHVIRPQRINCYEENMSLHERLILLFNQPNSAEPAGSSMLEQLFSFT